MFSKNKTYKQILATLVAVVIFTTLITSKDVFANTISDFTWLQSTGSKTVYLGNLYPGSDINNSGVHFYFVATSPNNGQFNVVLQQKGFLGIWYNVGSARIGYQTSEQRFDLRNGDYVYGQPNSFVWSTTTQGEYRIIMENPTNPQATGFTRVEAWAY